MLRPGPCARLLTTALFPSRWRPGWAVLSGGAPPGCLSRRSRQSSSALPQHPPRHLAPQHPAPRHLARRDGTAASGPEAPVLAEIIELALFALADLAPPGRADILVQAGEKVLEILLTLTPVGAIPGGSRRRGGSSGVTSRAGSGPGRHRAGQLRGFPLARLDPVAEPSRSLRVRHRLRDGSGQPVMNGVRCPGARHPGPLCRSRPARQPRSPRSRSCRASASTGSRRSPG